MDTKDTCEFSERLDKLISDAELATHYIGYLRGITGNTVVADRRGGSICGIVEKIARVSVKNGLILYCTRAWEEKPKRGSRPRAISLPHMFECLPALNVLEARKMSRLSRPLDVDDKQLATDFGNFKDEYEEAKSLFKNSAVEIIRHEKLAHTLPMSNAREKHMKDQKSSKDIKLDKSTYNDLLELAEKTVNLAYYFAYLWNQTASPYQENIERLEKITREFWRLVPVLKDVESPSL